MKKILLLLSILVFGFQANSQILISLLLGDKLNSDKLEFGLDGGLTSSRLNGPNAKPLQTFNIGFYFDIKFKNPSWMFVTGVQVKSNLGAKGMSVYSLNDPRLDTVFAGGSVTRKVSYFNVPIMVRHLFKNHIFAEAGFQTALRNKAYDYFYKDLYEEEDTYHKRSLKSDLKWLDFGLTAGLGYRLMGGNGMNLSARYYYGLVNIVKDPALASQQNSAWYFNVGIPIGKSPKPKN